MQLSHSSQGASGDLIFSKDRLDQSEGLNSGCNDVTAQSSNMCKGFLFMNNYCLFNNLAAMSFKVLLQQGISVLVFAFFRNMVLLVVSLLAYFLLHKKCLSSNAQPPSAAPPLKLFSRRFIMAQVRGLFGTISFLLFAFNLSLIPMTLVIIFF